MAMSKKDKNKAVIIALTHPLRKQILERVGADDNGGVSPSDLADELNAPLGNVSYHVRCLKEAGILKLVTTKQRRGAVEHFYKRADTAVVKKAVELLELIGKD